MSLDTHEKRPRWGSAHRGPCSHRRPVGPSRRRHRRAVALGRHAQRQRQNPQPAKPRHRGLCCPGFRASITRRPRTSAQERRRSAKWRAGAGQRHGRPFSAMGGARLLLRRRAGATPPPFAQAPVRGASSFAQAPARRAFPRSPRRAGTQRAKGKARSADEVCGAASGRQRPGADSRRGSRARRNRELGPSLRSLPFLPFRLLSPS